MVRPGTETEAGTGAEPKTGSPPTDPRRKGGASVNTRNKDHEGVGMGMGMGPRGSRAKASTTSSRRDINFELWTQKFVGAFGNLDAVRLDAFLPNETFAERQQQRVELYPNKLLNLQRRSLLVGSITYVPYTITNYVVSNCRLSLYLSSCCCFCCGHTLGKNSPSLVLKEFIYIIIYI